MPCHCERGWICEQHPDHPWPHDHARGQATLISGHPTAAAAFADIDRLAAQMARTGAPIELIVIDEAGEIVQRPGAH